MKNRLEKTQLHFCLALTLPQFRALEWKTDFKEVEKVLEDLPAQNLEYNGHFGANFFFSIDNREGKPFTIESAEQDANEVKKRILQLIRKTARRTKRV